MNPVICSEFSTKDHITLEPGGYDFRPKNIPQLWNLSKNRITPHYWASFCARKCASRDRQRTWKPVQINEKKIIWFWFTGLTFISVWWLIRSMQSEPALFDFWRRREGRSLTLERIFFFHLPWCYSWCDLNGSAWRGFRLLIVSIVWRKLVSNGIYRGNRGAFSERKSIVLSRKFWLIKITKNWCEKSVPVLLLKFMSNDSI